jgi:hypothetical protein
MRPKRGQRIAAAWALRGQPYPAMGAELPMRVDLAAAIPALVHEVVKLRMEFQECGLHAALLALVLAVLSVHGVLSLSHGIPADRSRRARVSAPRLTLRPYACLVDPRSGEGR